MLPPDLVSLAEREHRVAQILVGHALQFGHRAVHQGKEDVVGRNQVAIQVVFGDGLPPSEGLHLATMLDAGLHLLQTVAAEQQLAGKAFNVGVRKAFQKQPELAAVGPSQAQFAIGDRTLREVSATLDQVEIELVMNLFERKPDQGIPSVAKRLTGDLVGPHHTPVFVAHHE